MSERGGGMEVLPRVKTLKSLAGGRMGLWVEDGR